MWRPRVNGPGKSARGGGRSAAESQEQVGRRSAFLAPEKRCDPEGCTGSRPWLGAGTRESCGQPNKLLTRSASNTYFPQLLSVIPIRNVLNPVDEVVESLWADHLDKVRSPAPIVT